MIIENITKLDDSIEYYSPIIILSISGFIFCCLFTLTYKRNITTRRNLQNTSNNSSGSNTPSYNNELENIEENINNEDDQLPSYSELFNK